MKVLHIGLSCTHGGAESFLATLVREQRKVGIEAEVIFVADLGASSQFADACRIIFADREPLEEVLLKNHYDVLHIANHATNWCERAIRRTRYDGALVVTYHIWGARNHRIREDVTVGVSDAMSRAVQPEYEQEVRTVYNGIDTDFFSPEDVRASGKPIIAWVGRSNDAAKDVGALVAVAMSPIARDFRVVLVDGSAPGEEFRPYWLPDGATVEARKPWSEMPAFYRSVAASSGFLLSTARAEPFGLNAIEAEACGCPVIVPSSGGIPEVVLHEGTGYVYDPAKGVEGVAEGMRWLYRGHNYAAASRKAVEFVRERFSAESMCRGYTEVYNDAVAVHRPSAARAVCRAGLRAALPVLKPLAAARRKLRSGR